jgi:hypothetical protein
MQDIYITYRTAGILTAYRFGRNNGRFSGNKSIDIPRGKRLLLYNFHKLHEIYELSCNPLLSKDVWTVNKTFLKRPASLQRINNTLFFNHVAVCIRGSVVVSATSRKVAVLRPDEVNEFFNLPNPSGRTRPWGLLSL